VAVKIRLKRMGKIRQPFYRIVVADSHVKRDGIAIEQIGQYHPKSNPSHIQVDSERVQYWLSVGAQPTEPVRAILSRTGDWQKFKGLPAPEPLQTAPEPVDRRAKFDEAVAAAHGDLAGSAGSKAGDSKAGDSKTGDSKTSETAAESGGTADAGA